MSLQTDKLDSDKARIGQALLAGLPDCDARPQRLHRAMHHSVCAGGKRIRPLLLLACSELYTPIANALHAAVAIEYLHTYTLIHDDLPAVDNSDLRRGRATCHMAFDEATAILAGDALLTQAFKILSHEYSGQPELACALIRDLATAGDSMRLIGGQMTDIESEGQILAAETLNFIHRNKTGALLTAAITMGLEFWQPSSQQRKLAQDLGQEIGMAFQIIDDILDSTADTQQMGKPAGLDSSANKFTYVSLYGVDEARKRADVHSQNALEAAHAIGGSNERLLEIAEKISKRSY